MRFLPSAFPPTEQSDQDAVWFIFADDQLLVHLQPEYVELPRLAALSLLPLNVRSTQYLGTLDGAPCYAADVTRSDAPLPADMAFQGLRALFDALPEDIFWLAGRAFQLIHWERTHQYCGKCGTQTQPSTEERARICPACGQTLYPRISPAIIVAIIKDQQILLAHGNRFRPDLYSVIAGFVEPGETFEESVRREVYEEVGIDVRNIRYFSNQPWPFPDSLMIGFTAEYAGGEIRVDEKEISDAGWFRADNLPMIPGKISIARKLIDWFIAQYG